MNVVTQQQHDVFPAAPPSRHTTTTNRHATTRTGTDHQARRERGLTWKRHARKPSTHYDITSQDRLDLLRGELARITPPLRSSSRLPLLLLHRALLHATLHPEPTTTCGGCKPLVVVEISLGDVFQQARY